MRNSLKSLRYIIASTPTEFEQINCLWHEVYVQELGWLPASPGELFRDCYHPYSVYLLATAYDTVTGEDVAVGTLRIVLDSAIGLPIEQFISLAPLKVNLRPAESQRLMVSPLYRHRSFEGARFGVFAGLVKACIHYCFQNQIAYVVVDAFVDTPTTPIEQFKALGFEEFGAPFHDFELTDPSKSVALLLDTVRLLSVLYRVREEFSSYVLEFDSTFCFYDQDNYKFPQVIGE